MYLKSVNKMLIEAFVNDGIIRIAECNEDSCIGAASSQIHGFAQLLVAKTDM